MQVSHTVIWVIIEYWAKDCMALKEGVQDFGHHFQVSLSIYQRRQFSEMFIQSFTLPSILPI